MAPRGPNPQPACRGGHIAPLQRPHRARNGLLHILKKFLACNVVSAFFQRKNPTISCGRIIGQGFQMTAPSSKKGRSTEDTSQGKECPSLPALSWSPASRPSLAREWADDDGFTLYTGPCKGHRLTRVSAGRSMVLGLLSNKSTKHANSSGQGSQATHCQQPHQSQQRVLLKCALARCFW